LKSTGDREAATVNRCNPDKLNHLSKESATSVRRTLGCRRGVTVFVDFWHTVEFSRIRRTPSASAGGRGVGGNSSNLPERRGPVKPARHPFRARRRVPSGVGAAGAMTGVDPTLRRTPPWINGRPVWMADTGAENSGGSTTAARGRPPACACPAAAPPSHRAAGRTPAVGHPPRRCARC